MSTMRTDRGSPALKKKRGSQAVAVLFEKLPFDLLVKLRCRLAVEPNYPRSVGPEKLQVRG